MAAKAVCVHVGAGVQAGFGRYGVRRACLPPVAPQVCTCPHPHYIQKPMTLPLLWQYLLLCSLLDCSTACMVLHMEVQSLASKGMAKAVCSCWQQSCL